MPDNINELMWWLLNGAVLVVAFYIKNDLKEIKTDLRSARTMHDDHEKRIIRLETTCRLRHSDEEDHHRRLTDQYEMSK